MKKIQSARCLRRRGMKKMDGYSGWKFQEIRSLRVENNSSLQGRVETDRDRSENV